MNKQDKTVTFRFALHQEVRVVPMDLTGRIFARCERGNGERDYRVIYWANGERRDQWLYEHELGDANV